ncbi:ATP-binding cassette domain-containing protein [Stecheria intestinalis]|nr:ABC transporter ATP-binding protein [Stecheria intestinalis]
MRKLRRVLTVVLLSLSIFCVPVLARDTDVNLVNFYIPAQQKLAEYYLDAYCHGRYLFVNLVKTGSKTDKVNFRAVDSSETQLTTWGMAAEGTIMYNGKAVSSDTISDFNFGVSIEKPELINDLSGLANIRFLASFRKVVSNAQIQAWFERFGLSSAKNKKAGDYSLGMKQKLMLIQAFMEDPDVILLDEVTNSLDLQSREILFDVIREERAKGKVILLVDHDLEEMKEISDSIITIEKGEIRPWDFRK